MRRRWIWLAACVSLAVSNAAGAADPEDLRPFPAMASGEIPFDVDAARFCADGGGHLAEYYFRIPNRSVRFQPSTGDSGGPLTAQLECEITLLDPRGGELETRREKVVVSSGSSESAAADRQFQLVTLSYPLNPVAWGVRARVRDLGARKRGLAYLFTGRRRDGEAWAHLPARPAEAPPLCLSDIQFAWQIEASADSAGRARGRLHIVPNPGRTYGLRNQTLLFYYEVRAAGTDSAWYTADYEIEREGRSVYRSEPATVAAAGGWSMSARVDISALESGTYGLRVSLARSDGGAAASTSAPFNVLWTATSWDRSEEEVLDEADLYLSEEEHRTLEEMAAGDRARFLEEFWRRHDPTPETARNETYESFLERIDYAKRQFSTLRSGHLSDRGRIYIRYGEPDDLRREVIPVEADRLESALSDDPFLDPELKAALSRDRSRPRAYEIWSYYGRGNPLFPGRDLFPGGEQIRFIFVDDQGFGEFYLKYSTEHGAVR